MHGVSPYMRMCARIIMKISMLIDRYTDSLSFKFYESLFIGCGEIAKTNLSMHINNYNSLINILSQSNIMQSPILPVNFNPVISSVTNERILIKFET